ncbi:hypothetical protein CHS0354_030862 [Potamilus streckersoni]|uniref:Mitochondria-eating protein C-terminal domain-containing protein n=1 Tax=Potamilus streckersoni TaxID=2493646 RepID=A0AAE0SM83_9BIVA|nr:hypothetical protein CHS0354_030862 [Potamilus streckersoni]
MDTQRNRGSHGSKDQAAEYSASHNDVTQRTGVLNKTTEEKGSGPWQHNSQDLSDEILEFNDEAEKNVKREGELENLRGKIKTMEEGNKKLYDEILKKVKAIIQPQEKTESLEVTDKDEKKLSYLKESESLLRKINALDEEKKKLQDVLYKKEITIRELQEKREVDPAELKKKIDEQQSLIERLKAQEAQTKEECDRYCKVRDELDMKLKENEDINKSLKKDKNELLIRLSKIASDRLMHENTNITDLSDEIRPTKLAEKMQELYDNKWTDAFDELKINNYAEEETISMLLKILMETHKVCKEMTFSRYDKIKEACSYVEFSSAAGDEDKPEDKTAAKNKLSIVLQQDIKTIWRESSKILFKDTSPIIEKKVADKLDFSLLEMKQIQVYLKECIEICWMMNLQEKPMHLDINVQMKEGHHYFDSDKFRSFTETGQHVAFVVWPALYLFEGGPLLKKGVAQGFKAGQYSGGPDDSCNSERL